MLLAHHHHPYARAIAVIATFAEAGDSGQPAWVERPGPMGHGEREAIHAIIIVRVCQFLRHRVLDEEECSPQVAEATVAGTRRAQGGQQRPQVFAHRAHETALAFPGYAAAPLGRQPQAAHLALTHEDGWTAPRGHLGPDMTLV